MFRLTRIAFALLLGCITAGLSEPAHAQINFQVDVTCDNVYAIYYGTPSAAVAQIGYDNDWPSVESYNFTLPASDYIYVACYTDDAVAQGFLAQFTDLSNNARFYSSDPQWQVTATGLNLGTSDPPPTLSDLSTQIVLANAGSNPSGGWVATTVGQPNLNASPWGTLPIIDPQARWTWYDSGRDPSPFAPFNGFNHDEYLIFRIAVNASQDVPEPGAFAMLIGSAFFGGRLLLRCRRK